MHLGAGHDCGIVSDSVSGSMPKANPGTSHSVSSCDTHPAGARDLAVHNGATWLILVICCGDFCLWIMGIGTSHSCHTSSEGELVLHLCDGKQITITPLLSLLITLCGSKSRKEKLQPAVDLPCLSLKMRRT